MPKELRVYIDDYGKKLPVIYFPTDTINSYNWSNIALSLIKDKPPYPLNLSNEASRLFSLSRADEVYTFNGQTLTFTFSYHGIDKGYYSIKECGYDDDGRGIYISSDLDSGGNILLNTFEYCFLYLTQYDSHAGLVYKKEDFWFDHGNFTYVSGNVNRDKIYTILNGVKYTIGFPGKYNDNDKQGGDGYFDTSSDYIDFPEVPTITTLSTKLVSMYSPSLNQIQKLAEYLWSPTFSESIQKIFNDPMEAIMGLSLVNLNVATMGQKEIKIGNTESGVTSNYVGLQYMELDCGTIKIDKFWGNSLDYDPYTKIQIYLPYVGIETLSADDIMDSNINVVYKIDLLTGSALCLLKILNASINSVLYTYSCNISAQIPLSATNLTQLITSITSIIASTGVSIATGGAAAPLVATTAMSVLNAKTHVERSGRIDSSVGIMGIKKPYVIIERPVQSLAKDYNTFKGYPSNLTKKLSDLSGYTEVSDVFVKGVIGTKEEFEMIENLLKGGVIL